MDIGGNCNRRGWSQRPTDLETKLQQAKLERATNVMLLLYLSKNFILSIIIHKELNFAPYLSMWAAEVVSISFRSDEHVVNHNFGVTTMQKNYDSQRHT